MRYSPLGLCLNDFDIRYDRKNKKYCLTHIQGPPIYPYDAASLETSYGYAESDDLIKWNNQSTVFGISYTDKSFDNKAIWTMQTIEKDDRLWMFYTAINQENSPKQQIGLAYLEGKKWKKYKNNPILICDEKFYINDETMAFRDPFVFFDKNSNKWIMLFSAKDKNKNKKVNGCIGIATSENFLNWECREPVISPSRFKEMECPTIYKINNINYIFVSISYNHSIHAFYSKKILGNYSYIGKITSRYNYASRIISDSNYGNLFLHTVKRRWLSNNNGEIVRGYLAQPKILEANEKNIKLLWYPAIEDYLFKVPLSHIFLKKHNKFLIVIKEDVGSSINIFFTMDAFETLKIEIDNNFIFFNNEKIILNDDIKLANINSIKLLKYDEYIELYINDILQLSTFFYFDFDNIKIVSENKKPSPCVFKIID